MLVHWPSAEGEPMLLSSVSHTVPASEAMQPFWEVRAAQDAALSATKNAAAACDAASFGRKVEAALCIHLGS